MLLKYSQYQKRTKLPSGMPQRPTGNSKMLNGKGKGHRKGMRCAASKKLNHKLIASKKEEIRSTTVDPCDNSNDSGLGFDHHIEYQMPSRTGFVDQEYCWGSTDPKRQRLDIKLESDNANDDFTFPPSRIADPTPTEMPICLRTKPPSPGKMSSVHTGTQQGLSKNGRLQLQILSQPEMQHRARYQTEGSRGAVKDRSGNGFPVVRLVGYNKAATLEVYIGTDQGRVAPHMFYQACRVSGKNSTPCLEKKLNGTVLIEMQIDPTKEMTVTCDCVGILKERNVDVEHRFPDENPGRSKKKSTRCRMVFRTVVTLEDGSLETLQVTSQPIVCTQPPGVPEILKKSLTSVPADGGQEMFILGKNFLKDSRVTFSQGEPGTDNYWEAVVQPDKEYLQQSHMVCVVPPYRDDSIGEAVGVRLTVTSGGRSSELHPFFYTPKGCGREDDWSWPQLMGLVQLSPSAFPAEVSSTNRAQAQGLIPTSVYPTPNGLVGVQWHLPVAATPSTFVTDAPPVVPSANPTCDEVEMPPPTGLPPSRRGSDGKREAKSPTSSVGPGAGGGSLAATFQQFVSLPPATLPSLSVEGYLSTIAKQLPSSSQLPPTGIKAETAPPTLLDLHVSPPPPPPAAQQVILETKLEELMPQTAAELLYPTTTEVSVTTPSPVLTTAEFQAAMLAPVAAVAGVFPGDFVTTSPPGTAPPPTFLAFETPAQGPASTTAPPTQLLEPVVEAPSVLPPQDVAPTNGEPAQKKCEEGMPLPQELTQMSETDLLSYINPSCFDQGNHSTFTQFFI